MTQTRVRRQRSATSADRETQLLRAYALAGRTFVCSRRRTTRQTDRAWTSRLAKSARALSAGALRPRTNPIVRMPHPLHQPIR